MNKNYAAKRHMDSNNLGDSRLIALGDFTGGNLLVEEKGKILFVPTPLESSDQK